LKLTWSEKIYEKVKMMFYKKIEAKVPCYDGS